MNSKEMRYVRTIADLRSISKAAEKLYIAQPALSRYIRKMEDELGVELFDRTTTPLNLTIAGERYLEYVTIIEDLLRKMHLDLSALQSSPSGKLNAGVPILIGDYLLPRILPPFLNSNSTIQVETVLDYSQILNEKLLKHQLDFILTCFPINNSEINMEAIASDPILLVARRDHPALAAYDTKNCTIDRPLQLDIQTLSKECFIKVQPYMTLYHTVEKIFRQKDFYATNFITAPTIQFSLELAVQGVGFAFAMQSVVKYGRYEFVEQLCPIKVCDERLPVYLAYNRENCNKKPALNALVTHVKSAWTSCDI